MEKSHFSSKPVLRRPAVSCNGIGDSVESCCPFGKYSMCAYLNADQTLEDLERLYKRAGMPVPDVISNQLPKTEPDSRIRCEVNVIYVDFSVAV